MKEKMLLETVIGIFTVDKEKLRILLIKKNTNPYKGYWTLPGNGLKLDETLEDNISEVTYQKLGLKRMYIEQNFTFSNLTRNKDIRTLAVSYLGLTDAASVNYNSDVKEDIEMKWFEVENLPKLAYDHVNIIESLSKTLKTKITSKEVLKILFPSDFTLPELQNIYEFSLSKKLDRRNFRKKLLNLNYVVDTGHTFEGASGRPAKLYTFNESVEEKVF